MNREEIEKLLTEWEQYKIPRLYEGGAIDVMRLLINEFASINQDSFLPPAEGAEEFLLAQRNGDGRPITFALGKDGWAYKMIIHAMHEFAALHAQRIAEKMAEEKLIEFGNMIRDEPNGDIPALAEYFMRTINLKTIEP